MSPIFYIILYTITIAITIPTTLSEFTCQGTSFAQAVGNCPDRGAQLLSSGGNVSIILQRATNLPNRDFLGLSPKSDPYVRVTAGSIVRESSVKYNTLNPSWNGEKLSIGVLGSGTEILIETWDRDIGLEFSDDRLTSATFRVPFCSTFYANESTASCGEPFGCSVDDSRWRMPTRKLCNETGFIAFRGGEDCEGRGTCLFLEVHIVPFQMEVELEVANKVLTTPQLSAVGDPSAFAPWTDNFGLPFIGDRSTSIDNRLVDVDAIEGALLFRVNNNDRYIGEAETPKFYGSLNLPGFVYICRNELDNDFGIPNWITNEYSAANSSITRIILDESDATFPCFYQYSDGTYKNKYGGVESGAIAFKTNTIAGFDSNSLEDQSQYNFMYLVVSLPFVEVDRENRVVVVYDVGSFLDLLGSYGLIWMWFMFIVARFIKKIDYRIDRISSYVTSRVLTGVDRSLLAGLLLAYDKSPNNIRYRAYVYHATNAISFAIFVPIALLISWGFSVAATTRPPPLGFGLVFVGLAAIFAWYGIRLWERSKWRMSALTLASLSASVVSLMSFLFSVLFADPAVTRFGDYLNFTALSLFFGTLNTIPLLILIFKSDKTQRSNLRTVLTRMNEAVQSIQQTTKTTSSSLEINKLLHSILGDKYTINPKMPIFKFATVLQELGENRENDDNHKAKHISSEPFSWKELVMKNKLYFSSLGLLLIYIIIAAERSEYPSLAFLNCLAVLHLDTIHLFLSHGDIKWTPGFKIFLLVMGRLLIMGSNTRLWLLNYSTCYLLYALTLTQEMINTYLPMFSKRAAGEVILSGEHRIKEPILDIVGTTHFCLGWLTAAFSGIVIIVAARSARGDLPAQYITVWKAEWNIAVFGVIALLVTVLVGLASATVRSFYLESNGLLRGWAHDSYLFRRDLHIPSVFALFTELTIIITGLLIFAITDSAAVLVGSIFLPIIMLCMGYAGKTWVQNDFELVIWPPRYEEAINVASTDSLDEHNNKLLVQDISGKEDENLAVENVDEDKPLLDAAGLLIEHEEDTYDEDGNKIPGKQIRNSLKTVKGFKLPPMKATGDIIDAEIRMPALPLKSVLRRKRQNLGLKTKTPLQMKELRGRDDAVDHDRFGDAGDIVDAEDPWARFELEEDKVENIGKRKVTRTAGTMSRRQLWMQHKNVIAFKKFLRENVVVLWIKNKIKVISECCTGRNSKVYPIKYKVEEDEVEDPQVDGELKDEESEKKAKSVDEYELLEENLTPEQYRVFISRMPYGSAFWGGYLSTKDYTALAAWYGGMLAILFMGVTLSQTVQPAWLGNVIWAAIWLSLFASIPMIKYFNTYTFDVTMQTMVEFGVVFHFVFFVVYISVQYDGDLDNPGAVWLLSYFFYYPIFLYIIFGALQFFDCGCKFYPLDKDENGKITLKEIFYYLKSFPVILGLLIFLNWQFYIWIDEVSGLVVTLLIIIGTIAYIYIRDWASNDFFLSPSMLLLGKWMIRFTLFISFCVALFNDANPIFAISVFCFTFAFGCFTQILSAVIGLDEDKLLYFSPTLMPVYAYNSRKHEVVDLSQVMKQILYVFITGIVWGCFMAIFYYPINIGIALACGFLLALSAGIAYCVSYVPQKLAKYSAMLTPEAIVEAANDAVSKYNERRLPLNLEIADWYAGEEELAEVVEVAKTPTDLLMERSALSIAIEMSGDVRALKYIKEDFTKNSSVKLEDLDENEYEPTWLKKRASEFAAFMRKLYEMIPVNKLSGWKKHSEAAFNFTDATAESLITGRGPCGFFGVEGLWYRFFKSCKGVPYWKVFYPSWLEHYDENGNNLTTVQLSETMDTIALRNRLVVFDKAIDHTYSEESRCAINFLLVLLIGAEAKLQREQVLFQKFLRQNRYRLASNNITPPPDIFSSSSYASINTPLVAIWLSSLPSDERDRFHLLYNAFVEEQKERDMIIDNADHELAEEAILLEQDRKTADKQFNDRLNREIFKEKESKVQEFADSLVGLERQRFGLRREIWTTDLECFVDVKEKDLYDRFRAYCMSDRDEYLDYCVKALTDIEAAQRDTRLGEYGRSYQFVDSEFPPNDMNIGNGQCAVSVLGWRCSNGIVENVQLFDGGTDPNAIVEGVFNDTWLLSAIEMIVAASEFGDGVINQQIAKLFVGHPSADGELTTETNVGAYCVQLFKNGQWVPIIVDDILPMRRKEYWSNENRGMACAHNKECRGIWVSLIEKAYAKYYGSYSQIEKGFVQHALHEMTGCEAECIPLSSASRGVGKRALWNMLMHYRRNGYILGAGTGDSKLADSEIQNMGIIFNSAYTIYDVAYIDGHRLLRMRNPPGDHHEWRGDWSDKSKLWTRRLKHKLGWLDSQDNVFFMSFDDFCNVFRHLYVCKYYNPNKWIKVSDTGFWKKSNEALVEQLEMMNKFMNEEVESELVEVDNDENDRKKAKARVDTAGGLPHRHNPACIVENNPQYSLLITRPTDLRITVRQFNAKPSAPNVPFSIFIVKNEHAHIPARVNKLTKENLVDSTDECLAEPSRHLYTSLNPGLYIVMPATYIAGMENNFKITVLSNHRAEFKSIWPPLWMLKDLQKEQERRIEMLEKRMSLKMIGSAKSARKQMNGWSSRLRKGVHALFGGNEDDDDDDDEDALGSPKNKDHKSSRFEV